jgi:hypothetical protein
MGWLGGGKKLATDVAGFRSRRRASSRVFGQTKPIEDALGARVKKQSEEHHDLATALGEMFHLAPTGHSRSVTQRPEP